MEEYPRSQNNIEEQAEHAEFLRNTIRTQSVEATLFFKGGRM